MRTKTATAQSLEEFIRASRAPLKAALDKIKASIEAKLAELEELKVEQQGAKEALRQYDEKARSDFSRILNEATSGANGVEGLNGKPAPAGKPGPKKPRKNVESAADLRAKAGRPAGSGRKGTPIIQSIVNVLGKKTLSIPEIMEELKAADLLPNSTNPQGYVSGILSSHTAKEGHPEREVVFEAVKGKGRGRYRVAGFPERKPVKPAKVKPTVEAASTDGKPSIKEAIIQVFEAHGGGEMTNKEIIAALREKGWYPASGNQYVSTVLTNVKNKDTFEQVGRGTYRLAKGATKKAAKAATAKKSTKAKSESEPTSAAGTPTTKQAVILVFEANGGGEMTNKEVVEALREKGWLPASGAGYISTVLTNVKNKDTFEQVAHGKYRLLKGAKASKVKPDESPLSSDEFVRQAKDEEEDVMKRAHSMFSEESASAPS